MAERASLADLDLACRRIKHRNKVGTFWRHYKSGEVYEITQYSVREHDGEMLVSYKPVKDNDSYVTHYVDDTIPPHDQTGQTIYDDVIFTRPVTEWEELVEINHGESRVDRFTQVYRFQGYREYPRDDRYGY